MLDARASRTLVFWTNHVARHVWMKVLSSRRACAITGEIGWLFFPLPDIRSPPCVAGRAFSFGVQYDVHIKHKNVLPTGEDKSPLVSVKYAMP